MKDRTKLTAEAPPSTHEQTLEQAFVWAVDPSRGDLYVVHFPDRDVLVQLQGGGICNRPEQIMARAMTVMLDRRGNVIALPIEDSNGWRQCSRLPN